MSGLAESVPAVSSATTVTTSVGIGRRGGGSVPTVVTVSNVETGASVMNPVPGSVGRVRAILGSGGSFVERLFSGDPARFTTARRSTMSRIRKSTGRVVAQDAAGSGNAVALNPMVPNDRGRQAAERTRPVVAPPVRSSPVVTALPFYDPARAAHELPKHLSGAPSAIAATVADAATSHLPDFIRRLLV